MRNDPKDFMVFNLEGGRPKHCLLFKKGVKPKIVLNKFHKIDIKSSNIKLISSDQIQCCVKPIFFLQPLILFCNTNHEIVNYIQSFLFQ